MKKTYISPETVVTVVELTGHLMAISQSETEINANNAGLVKGASSSSNTPSNYSVWDDDWSN